MAATESTYVCNLSPEVAKKAEEELFETPERRNKELRKLRDLIKRHGALHCRTDASYLLRFLRARKFDSELALEMIINYYTIRAENEALLGEVLPSALTPVLEAGVNMMLPSKDKECRAILYVRPGRWVVDKFSMLDCFRVEIMNLEQAVLEEENQVHGLVVIGDFGELGMNHVLNFDRKFAKLSSSLLQDAFPLRIKAMHIVNEPAIFSYVFAIIRPLMKAKLASRLHFHGSDRESLYKHFNKTSLPEELGGELAHGNKITEEWKKKLDSQEDMYKELAKNYLELPKDVGPLPKDVEVVGTGFRKLDLD